jgi:hypothetical protein
MSIFRWVCAGLFAALALCFIGGNLFIVFRDVRGKAGGSLLPFVGGVAGAISLLLIPQSQFRPWWWVPLVADAGSAPLLLWTTVWLIWRFFHRHRQT